MDMFTLVCADKALIILRKNTISFINLFFFFNVAVLSVMQRVRVISHQLLGEGVPNFFFTAQ